MILRAPAFALALLAASAAFAEAHYPASAVVTDAALHPWSTNTHPTDVAKSHIEEITASTGATYKYTVLQSGMMDGRNCRSPMGCGIAREGAFLQTWESNRSVRMENIGSADVVNPWLSNGRNNFRSVEEIVSSAVSPGMTDADKAFALWFQEIQYRHHSPGDNGELGDPVKVFNVYGYNTCGNDSICLATLWREAGLKVAPARALGHCISQAFYDGGWHFYDGDMHSVYLFRDNQTVAGEQDIVRAHDLIKRLDLKPGTSEFATALAEAVSGLGTVAVVTAKVDKALKTVGISADDYVRQGDRESLDRLIDQKLDEGAAGDNVAKFLLAEARVVSPAQAVRLGRGGVL